MELVAPVNNIPKTDKIGLIDADFLKYLVAHDIKKDIEEKNAFIFKNPVHHYTQQRVDFILNSFECKKYIFCFSGPSHNTFRCSVAFEKKYKGTRDYVPAYENELQDKLDVVKYIRERYPSLLFKDLEADDVISMLQDDETFVYSKDKDLLQIPGTHFNLKTGLFYEITKEQGMRFLLYQLLEGDSVDNIVGLKSYGKVTIEKLLTNVPTKNVPFKVLLEFMKKKGMSEGIDCFVEAWLLLRLRTNRGEYFLSNYKSAFDLLRMLKLE